MTTLRALAAEAGKEPEVVMAVLELDSETHNLDEPLTQRAAAFFRLVLGAQPV